MGPELGLEMVEEVAAGVGFGLLDALHHRAELVVVLLDAVVDDHGVLSEAGLPDKPPRRAPGSR
jgi:hypothetical protein